MRPDGADAGRVAEVVRSCPSGALRYERVDGGEGPQLSPA
ncbi:(4Fe-4S)-binding protein [Streptomyces anulatus]